MTWYPVIGLEVHIQLDVTSKLFSKSATTYGAKPNSQASFIDLGLPGTLPVLNKEAITQAVRFGFASDAKVNNEIRFDRKNYFYPDLPKGYQITQHYNPFLWGGHIDINTKDGNQKRIRIHHTHIEEDAGKSQHAYQDNQTGIDLNRAGIPLLEVVSEPDLRSADEAVQYLKVLHNLVVFLGICDGNMQEGSMRCDANVSIRNSPEAPFGTRVEIKNINSFKFVEKAINYEIKRQAEVLTSGGTIKQQTRLFDETQNITKLMREKEHAHDYRYIPEPDIPPIYIDDETIAAIRKQMPELPKDKMQRYMKEYDLTAYDAGILAYDRDYAQFFEALMSQEQPNNSKTTANWLLGTIAAALNRTNTNLSNSNINPQQIHILLKRIEEGVISNNIAKTIFEQMWQTGEETDTIIDKKGLKLINDESAIMEFIDEVVNNNPKQVTDYKEGNVKLFGYLVGQCMKISQGKVDPAQLNKLLKKKLG